MQEKQNSFSDAVQKGISAANTVRGAVKTGKEIASAAKGGAAGGWVGAAASFAWENRRTLAAVVAGLTVLFLLPVVIVCMLPSLIFGGFDSGLQPESSIHIFKDGTVITENIEDITNSLDKIINESLNSVLKTIKEDQSKLPEGAYTEVENPFAEGAEVSAITFISQYCASKEKDYRNISKEDLMNTVIKNKDKLFSFEKKEEIRREEKAVTVVDAASGKETETVITEEKSFTVYTVVYNGQEYFANNIFYLTGREKEIAKYYEENLTLYLGES